MTFGLIGTGAIAEAVITGMLANKAFAESVVISARSVERSTRLADRFENVSVEPDNQKIIDQADVVFLSVLPNQAESVIGKLNFLAEQKVVSMVAGRSLASLAKLVAPATNVFRIIPMPPIELGVGPIVITPPSEELAKLFNRFGTAVEVENEDSFSAFSASSGIMATFFEFVAAQARWLESQGISQQQAAEYASSLTRALAEMTTRVSPEQLQEMSEECLTVGGLNEQVLKESHREGWFEQIGKRLDRIAARLAAAKEKSL